MKSAKTKKGGHFMESGKNKIGICEWSLPIDGPYACKLAASLGIDGIQLNIGDAERGFPLSKKVVQEAWLEASRETGVLFPSIAVRTTDYFSMMAPKGSEDRETVMTAIYKAIDAAVAMNIPLVMIPQFVKSAIETEDDFQCVVKTLQDVCQTALEKSIIIATENLLTVDELSRLFKEVDRSNLRLYFDTQNYYLNKGYDTPSLIEALMPFIYEVHVKDGKENDLSGALLGTGDTKFFESVDLLKKNGYTGWFVSENYYDQKPLSLQNEDPTVIIREDIAILKQVLAEYKG
jgi:2-epi-5-epi-valiolone 7-phosphate 2-epimerase